MNARLNATPAAGASAATWPFAAHTIFNPLLDREAKGPEIEGRSKLEGAPFMSPWHCTKSGSNHGRALLAFSTSGSSWLVGIWDSESDATRQVPPVPDGSKSFEPRV